MNSIRAISDTRGQSAWAAVSEGYKSKVRLALLVAAQRRGENQGRYSLRVDAR